MTNQKWLLATSIIIFVALIGTTIYILSQQTPPQNPKFQLNLTNLTASTDGQITFNITLNQGESTTLNTITINQTQYNWSDGSQQDPNITQGQTKQWSTNIGPLTNGTNLNITVDSTPTSASGNTTVKPTHSEPTNKTNSEYLYDNYGGVGLFDEGIHITATTQDPTTIQDQYPNLNEYWSMLKQNETNTTTNQKFVSIILARGDKPTGAYTINVQNFAWLESYPVKFLFQINVTDPHENMTVTQAITNPLVLIPIGKLTPGQYNIEVNVTWFIQSIDQKGNTIYTPVMTFAPIIWKQTLTIN